MLKLYEQKTNNYQNCNSIPDKINNKELKNYINEISSIKEMKNQLSQCKIFIKDYLAKEQIKRDNEISRRKIQNQLSTYTDQYYLLELEKWTLLISLILFYSLPNFLPLSNKIPSKILLIPLYIQLLIKIITTKESIKDTKECLSDLSEQLEDLNIKDKLLNISPLIKKLTLK